MTRFELLQTLVRQARLNGFEFRKWYITQLSLPWTTFEAAVEILLQERRYYALVFSHEFAQSLWKDGEKMTFVVPNTTFTRTGRNGKIITVQRKAFTRRSSREGVWRFHLQQLALADEPLRYLRRYLITAEHLLKDALNPETDFEPEPDLAALAAQKAAATAARIAPTSFDILGVRQPRSKLT